MRTKGLVEEECLPYKPEVEKCEGMCENPTRLKIDSYCLLIWEDEIKRDILKNWSVVSTSQVFIDLLNYKSWVYSKWEDVARFSWQTSVRIVGWGVESGDENDQSKWNKYWIIENTWGKSWWEEWYAKVWFWQDMFFD